MAWHKETLRNEPSPQRLREAVVEKSLIKLRETLGTFEPFRNFPKKQ